MDAAVGIAATPPIALRSADAAAVRVQPATPSAGQQGPQTQAQRVVDSRREVSEDSATGSLVYRLVDLSTGTVTVQTPTDAKLKLRAYIDQVFSKRAEPTFQTTA